MQQIALALAVVALVFAGQVGAAGAQEKDKIPAWDPNTVKTMKFSAMGLTTSHHGELFFLKVKDSTGNHLVMLGPKSVVDNDMAKIPLSTEIEVTASVVTRGKGHRRTFLAQTIRVKDTVYRFRDDKGEFLDKPSKSSVPATK
ncbi:MAG TPA: hypothetical protein VEL75_02105 [Candidatus Methylomirabilis sp.]|nr:hypothetical protein [Candidatus Methylomirabilis sp.]